MTKWWTKPTNPQPDVRTNITLYMYRYTEGLQQAKEGPANNSALNDEARMMVYNVKKRLIQPDS